MCGYFSDLSCKKILPHIQPYSYGAKRTILETSFRKDYIASRTKVSNFKLELFLIFSKLQKGLLKKIVDDHANNKNSFYLIHFYVSGMVLSI